ncbi:sulfite exporter TauE/SafE family protein [Herbaspirillum lusitanum]|uniref:Probable membrane transporter protein n=1 Tax=Herbaspirillum lusitanum TaxID=213312 RepID=A0ABW9A4W6_9BURK
MDDARQAPAGRFGSGAMMLSAPPLAMLLLALISLLAGMAKGVTGFGAALVMAPLFGVLLPSPESGALIVLINCAASLQGWRRWSRLVRWRSLAGMAAVALICTALGVHWIASHPLPWLNKLVGVVVLIVTMLHMRGWRWHHRGGARPATAAGILSGAMTALSGIGGVPAVYYFSGLAAASASEHKAATEILRANLLGYFAVLYSGAVLILAANHQVHVPLLLSTLVLVPAFAAGVLIGERIYHLLPRIWFNRSVAALLLASGVVALVA